MANEADAQAILALLEQCSLPTMGVAEHLPSFVVARSEGIVVGTSGVEAYDSSGLLRSVAVHPSSRERGLAAVLVEHAASRARRDGLDALYLLTTTAKAYFERRGFGVCPRDEAPPGIRGSWEFRTGCPDSAVFMRRPLG